MLFMNSHAKLSKSQIYSMQAVDNFINILQNSSYIIKISKFSIAGRVNKENI